MPVTEGSFDGYMWQTLESVGNRTILDMITSGGPARAGIAR
jgi:hypothetical protein